MKRLLVLIFTFVFFAVAISATIGGSVASARICLLRSPKGGHACLRWGPPDSTTTSTSTTSTTTTTTLPYLDDCAFGSAYRAEVRDNALRYYAGQSTRDSVDADAQAVISVCTGYPGDEALIAAAQVVVDCFATTPRYFMACAQPPGNEVGFFAAALGLVDP